MRIRLLFAALLAAVAPIALAPAAGAVTTTTWDRVAQCESSGNWHINTGNGYYGGLQIARRTWDSFGGPHYASLPNRASKRQQITIANRILKGQGVGAWGYCGRRAGL